MSSPAITPLFDRILIQPCEPPKQSSIIVSASANERPAEGIVIAHGKGKRKPDGSFMELNVKIGDRVAFNFASLTNFVANGQKYAMIKEDDILAVVHQ